MFIWKPLMTAAALGLTVASLVDAQAPDLPAAAAQMVKADADFAQAVAERNSEKFLSFIAEDATFGGGTPDQVRGRDAVMKEWAPFFEPNGPTLTWAPTKGEAIGAGDVGYTVGTSVFRSVGADGKVTVRPGQYVTVWKKQPNGSWQAIFDTGSTLP
jgi:ketosteroid isomerase-like protein